MMSRRFVIGALPACAVWPAYAASPLPRPSGEVLLTVSGAISVTNVGQGAVFDRAMLQALDWVELETYTSFTSGVQRFAGPTLVSVLEAVGAEGSTLSATALNDYTVTIPVEHARAHEVILAMDMNGRPMRVRDKGPIWVVYPLSQSAAEQRPFDGQMIWQLVQIRVD